MYSSESRSTPSDMGILTSATTSYDVVAAGALPGAISANTSEQSSRTVEPRMRMSSPPVGRVAVNGPATLGDLRGREDPWHRYFGRRLLVSSESPLGSRPVLM